MSHRVYKFKPGQCTCLMGDMIAGSSRVNVRKISGTEAVLEPTVPLKENQFIYTTVELEEGPSLSLAGLVVSSAAGGILVQWEHGSPRDADKVDVVLRMYKEQFPDPDDSEEDPAEEADGGETAGEEEAAGQEAEAPAPGPRPKERGRGRTSPRRRITPRSKLSDRGAPAPRATHRRVEPGSKRASKGAPSPTPEAEQPIATFQSQPGHHAEIVITDGKVDVSASILRHAKKVRSSELAARLDTVQVLNMSTIRELIVEAVNEAVAFLGSRIGEEERKRLLEAAEDGFKERLEAFQAEKVGLEEQTKHLQGQLEKAQELLTNERKKVVSADRFTVSDASIVELEQRLGRLLDRAARTGGLNEDLEHDMRQVVMKLLDDERDKIREQAQQAQNDAIALLEKKVSRLANSLDDAEKERDSAQRRAQALEASGGLPLRNIMEAGLEDDGPDRERKLGLLKEIFDFNKKIRDELQQIGRLPKKREAPAKDEGEKADAVEDATGAATSSEKPPTDETPENESRDAGGADEKDGEGTVTLAVSSAGEDVDPDDLSWEPPENSGKAGAPKIKRLGG